MASFIFAGVFWGSLLILLGITSIINTVFHLNIPFLRLIFAFMLIYFGVKMLINDKQPHQQQTVFMSEDTTTIHDHSKHQDYNIVFGSRTIDLTTTPLTENTTLHINVVFGQGVILIAPDMPVLVASRSAFGSVTVPDQTQIALGSHVYKTAAYDATKPHIDIETNSVFGSLRVEYKKP